MDLREVLLEVRQQRGVLTPEIVVEEARNEDHPLHHRFEWDDGVAAHKWRLSQASELLRVTYRPGGGAPEVRAFWPQRTTGETVYQPTEEIVADPISREVMLREMEREWRSFQRRYQHMEEFVQLVSGAVPAA